VFSEISQYIMSKGMYRSTAAAADSNSVFVPDMTKGDPQLSRNLLQQLDLSEEGVNLADMDTVPKNKVPDVRGMGARDAVSVLQDRGLKVRLAGMGRVTEQNMPAGTEIVKGKTITLTLKNE
jgi:cell division protein FtsI (penicillin-binding protein 3)